MELVAGTIASAVANFGFARPKKWATPASFGLGPRRKAKPKKPVEVDEQDQAARLRVFFKGLVAKKEESNG